MGLRVPTSIKLHGANLAVDWLHGLFQTWSLYDWAGFIKPTIDNVVGNGIGANCVRIIGSYQNIHDGTLTQATYNTQMVQIASYLNTLGVYFYPAGGYFDEAVGITDAEIAASANSTLAALAPYSNVIGFDVMQEQDSWGPVGGESNPAGRTINIYNLIKASGTQIPLTFSSTAYNGTAWIASIASALDFLDFHPYPQNLWPNPMLLSSMSGWRALYPNMDIMFGEYGTTQAYDVDTQVAFAKSVHTLAESGDPHFRGALRWCVRDYVGGAANEYGMYDVNWVKYPVADVIKWFSGGNLAKSN